MNNIIHCAVPDHKSRVRTQIWRIMRLSFIFIFAALMQVSALTKAQKVTFKQSNVTLEEVFKAIRKQTGYNILWSGVTIKNTKKVSVNFNNTPLDQAINASLENQDLTYEIDQKTIIITKKTPSFLDKASLVIQSLSKDLFQSIDVRGVVKDEQGNPLPNASIRVKGKSAVTNTNEKGEFSLSNVADDAVLLVSYVGYKTLEISLKDAVMPLEIKLNQQTGELEEVNIASTGYQKIKPNEVTGSVVLIDNKTLNEQTGTNILQRLNGVTSSLTFNIGKNNSSIGPPSKTNITIRGFSTINGPLDPLIVLDNFIYEGDINNINPNDVESVTVLKDAAAASIWGARAGNGVIVITSKRGKYNQPLKIEMNSNVMITEKPDLYYLPQISSSDYIDVEQFLYSKGFFDTHFSSPLKPGITPAVEIFRKRALGQISSADSATQINALKSVDSRDEYIKHFYQNGVTQQYSLNLRGGSDNMTYMISGAYDKTIGNLANKADKINVGINNTYQPLKNFQIGLGVYYTNQSGASGKPGYNSIKVNSRDVPYLKFKDEQGNPIAIANQYNGSFTDTVGGGQLLNWKYYPANDYKHDSRTTNQQELLANLAVNYQLIKDLSFDLNYQYQKQWGFSESLADLESFRARDLINLYTNLSTAVAGQKYPVAIGGILRNSSVNVGSQNLRTQVSYDKSWVDHSISAILGAEAREVTGESSDYTLYGYQQDPLAFTPVDFKTSYPTIVHGGFNTIPGGPSIGGVTINRFISIYTNFLYTFKQRYNLSGSMRRDGANIFGLSTNDKFNPLWSAGIGWDLSEEYFYSFEAVPTIRLKSTFGYSGNVDLRRSPLPIASYAPSSPYTGFPFATINTINNPSLRWEQVRQWNFALEFASKSNIVSGSFEYYRKKGIDLYGETSYDYTAWGGLPELTENVAAMKGEGIDVTLKSKIIDKKLKWTANLLYSYNSSKTTDYFNTSAESVFTLSPNNISPVIGKPLYAIVAYKWGGLNQSGDPQGYLNGQLSTDYRQIQNEATIEGLESGTFKYVGPAVPTSFGSFVNEITCNNFSFSFNLSYRFGYYFQKSSITYSSLYNNGIGHRDFENRWKQPGDELSTNVPSMVYTNYPQFSARDQFYGKSEINVLKGDNLRLQYVNLRYTMPIRNKKHSFSQVQLYLNAANLGIIWRANKENLDPDYPASIPEGKSFAIGIRAGI